MNKSILILAGAGLVLPTTHAVEIANSIADFSSIQGQNNWITGYRNYTEDGGGDDYDPTFHFIPFTASQWNGSLFKIGGNPPWTECGPEACHPNSGGAEHWIIRRWQASVTELVPLEITLAGRKNNGGCGSGVTIALYQNGILQYSEAIEGSDTGGIAFTYYLNVLPGDLIDAVLTPVGTDGDRGDGCDGSSFSMTIDDELPANPEQPDGTPFVPASLADTDGDGIPDVWELAYAEGAGLGRYTATGDFDGDGLLDKDEYIRGTHPNKADTDGDGLSDAVETKTGIYVSLTDTGSDPTKVDSDGDGISDADEVNGTIRTNPNLADSDSDGFSDPDELFFGSDPNADSDTPLSQAIADSVTQFSGVQGQDGWEYGYRILSGPRPSLNYHVTEDFIPFAGGSNIEEPWEGGPDSVQHWRGTAWDLQDNNPWTTILASGAHPNGINNGETHWSIRRWKATALTTATPICLYWQTRKDAQAGGGVTGMVFVNGKIVDLMVVPGSDIVGSIRKCFLVLQPNDVVDLVLTPSGTTDSYDWSDGSSQWMRLDGRLPSQMVASSGAFFAAPGATDSDGDGLPDAWELYYTADNSVTPPTPGSLTVLTNATADNDGDGLTNAEELARGTHPLFADTDSDGLSDKVETGTGVFVSLSETGTNPLAPDSDYDGLSDLAEVTAIQFKTDPYVADTDNDGLTDRSEVRTASNPTVADPLQVTNNVFTPLGAFASSLLEFTGSQDELGWSSGYRNLSLDEGELDYDPETAFIPFVGGDGEGEWDGIDQQWDGGSWRLSDGAPWTNVGREYTHPNGANNGEAHWTIRRWTASTLTEPRDLGLMWHVSKSNTGCGDGVTAALYLNGKRTDEASVAFDDGLGVTHVFYATIQPNDVVDLVLQHNGNEGGDNDWCDGSNTILRVIEDIPSPAIQPDGSVFGAVVAADFVITSITRGGDGAVTLAWPTETGKTYDVYASPSLADGSWIRISPEGGITGNGANAEYTDSTLATQNANTVLFYRVGLR